MSTFTSEPGTRLGGRYRLEDRVNGSGGWSAWKAIDETLARPVTVLTFAQGFPRIREVTTAARAASRLTDARLAQVFDVEENWDQAYVVMEWVGGDSLHDLLADGPLEPAHGAEIIAEGAEALAVAHAAGVAHLCLTPGSLRWTPGGGVKISGLGIDAALSGMTADDPALADTRGLGRLLYAALTATWPGQDWPALPPAPEADGRPRSPRQVRAGVPADIDEIACQALFGQGRGGEPGVATPALLADALAQVIPAPLAPPPATTGPNRTWDSHRAGPDTGPPYWRQTDDEPQHWGDPSHGGPPRGGLARGGMPRNRPPANRNRAVIAAVTVLVVAVAGAGIWLLGQGGKPAHGTTGQSASTAPPSAHAVSVLTPQGAGGFDPLSSTSDDPGNENTDQAHFAIDSDPHTAWHSQYYFSPLFGNLKKGTGLMLDMGKPVKLASVQVKFGSIPGADVQIELGDSNVRAASTLSGFTTVAQGTDLSGTHTFTVSSSAKGRYVLIWFTKLPPQSAGSSKQFEAKVFDVVVRGTS